MAFKRVVVLGGGPIGLMCAIEAAEQLKWKFKSKVTVVEMRSEYSRMNVPVLHDSIQKHLGNLTFKDQGVKTNVAKMSGIDGGKHTFTSLFKLEDALTRKARNAGVVVKNGWVPTNIIGRDELKYGRYKSAIVSIAKWDHQKRAIASPYSAEMIKADLIVVAVGGSGVEQDIFTHTLDFEHGKLAAETYALYGVYQTKTDKGKGFGQEAKEAANRLGNIIKVGAGEQSYLLVTLKDVSPSDFQKLKSNAQELRKLMGDVGKAYDNRVLGPLDQANKSIGAFEVKIKRAKHVLSPKYPAILVGDAAVTPHPQTGTGILTGFHGFEAFREMLIALRATTRSSESAVTAMDNFESSYEIFISAKALEGTVVTLTHLQGLLDGYTKDCDRQLQKLTSKTARQFVETDKNIAGLLHDTLGLQVERAMLFAGELLTHVNRGKTTPVKMRYLSSKLEDVQDKLKPQGKLGAKDSVQRLWADIGDTYNDLLDLVKDYEGITNLMENMASKIK